MKNLVCSSMRHGLYVTSETYIFLPTEDKRSETKALENVHPHVHFSNQFQQQRPQPS